MTDNTQDPVGQVDQEPVAQSASEDKVAYATFKKVLDEKKQMQSQFAEMKAQFDRLQADREAAEQQKLIEQNNFKALYEAEASKAKKAMEMLEGHKRDLAEKEKKKAVLSKLGLKRDEFAKFVDLDAIQGTDGQVDPTSLEAYVQDFRSKFPELVVESKTPPPTSPAPSVKGNVASYDKKNPAAILEEFKKQHR